MANPDLTELPSPVILDGSDSPLSSAGKTPHPLDNPIWSSLHTEHRSLAISNALARRYPAAIGPLAGIASQSAANYEALRELAEPGGIVVLFCTEAPTPPPDWTLIRGGLLAQMIC